MQKEKKKTKTWKIIIAVLAGFTLLGYVLEKVEENELANPVQTESTLETPIETEVITPEQTPEEKLNDQLTSVLATFENPYDRSDRESTMIIQLEIAMFDAWAQMYTNSITSTEENKKLGDKLKAKLTKIQTTEFPKLRKAYKDVIYKELWLENIETKIKGKKYDVLDFISGGFYNNRTKQESMEAIYEVVHSLRFKKVNFKIIARDNDYTVYTIKSPKDNVVE